MSYQFAFKRRTYLDRDQLAKTKVKWQLRNETMVRKCRRYLRWHDLDLTYFCDSLSHQVTVPFSQTRTGVFAVNGNEH